MTTGASALLRVEVPDVAIPAPYGLLDTVGVVEGGVGHWQFGVQYESVACVGAARSIPTSCAPGLALSQSGGNPYAVTVDVGGLTPGDVYRLDWGDGGTDNVTVDAGGHAAATHTYPSKSDYYYVAQMYLVSEQTNVVWSAGVSVPLYQGTKQSDTGTMKTVTGDPFAVYKLVECGAVGTVDIGAQARRALELGESVAVERMLATRELGGAASEVGQNQPRPPEDAIALLEQAWVANYGTQPVIHMTRDVAVIACAHRALYREGTGLYTCLGSPVVAGAGYELSDGMRLNNTTDNSTDYAGGPEGWVYATGPVVLRRSPVQVNNVIQTDTNTVSALAERVYVATVECGPFAAKVERPQ